MASAAGVNGGGGAVVKRMGVLRVQYYCVMGAVAAAVVLATLRYMPAATTTTGAVVVRQQAPGEESAGVAGSLLGGRKRKEDEKAEATTSKTDQGKKRKDDGVVVFNFGDSNSDTGGVAAVMGIRIAPPEGRAYFRHPTGRLSDGRVILDFICESLGTRHLSPYMKPLGSDYTNGVNFAIAGSTATPGATSFSLDVQVDQFLFFRDRCLESSSSSYVDDRPTAPPPVDEQGFSRALYTIDIGHNDVNGILHLPYRQMLQKLPAIVAEIRRAIETLHERGGARKFLVHGTGALGCMPQKLATMTPNDELDENGCVATVNDVCRKFNALLSAACDDLRLRLKKSTVVFVDMFAIKYDLVANHTEYGIEKPLMTCCGHGGPPYNYDPKRSCMTSDKYLCKLGEKFISWDGVHFTDAANGIVASKVLSGDYSIPRVKLSSVVVPPESDD